MLKQAACIKLVKINKAWAMSCLNLMEMFKGKRVKVEAEPKRGPGRPKKARFDIESTMVGIESSEAVGSHP